MRTLITSLTVIFTLHSVNAQSFTLKDLEGQFLKNNALLIANKYNIDKADVEIIQEKLWQNPTLSISEVNLWKTYAVEEQPYLIGKYGNNQQISIELEQLIETAGKRRKRVALKQVEKQTTLFEFEELLRTLKKELRLAYFTLNRIHSEEKQLNQMIELLTKMSEQFKHQVELKNIPKVDFYRIQSELLGLKTERIELEKQKLEVLKQLRIFTNNKELAFHTLFFDAKVSPKQLPLNMIELAKRQNIGLKKQLNELERAEKALIVQKANRTPDLIAQVNYDRGGNIMRDFMGFGVSIDLPIFNNNKQNVKLVELAISQEKSYQSALEINLEEEITQLETQFKLIEDTMKEWPVEQLNEQSKMIENFKKHLLNRQVTLIEFIDFIQAYREANRGYIQLEEAYNQTIEELQYIVGNDF